MAKVKVRALSDLGMHREGVMWPKAGHVVEMPDDDPRLKRLRDDPDLAVSDVHGDEQASMQMGAHQPHEELHRPPQYPTDADRERHQAMDEEFNRRAGLASGRSVMLVTGELKGDMKAGKFVPKPSAPAPLHGLTGAPGQGPSAEQYKQAGQGDVSANPAVPPTGNVPGEQKRRGG